MSWGEGKVVEAAAEHKLVVIGGQTKLHHPVGETGHCAVQDALELSVMARFMRTGLYRAWATRGCRLHTQEIYTQRAKELVG